ncbi:ABC transporter ATP-binding protein [Holospora curviuscula]|uniref:Multidrug resistance-like ATP-binding protein MdlB n=1 Tax=Holospora curviuscula TaxID=1082868 RepID=A0A2S5R9S3_9PROT|nr:ABC transporter ATP-binding protein [Holospora curviuscula]PPE04058.1 putative ABC transporter ATP-binding protein [Holospora curviuscula]
MSEADHSLPISFIQLGRFLWRCCLHTPWCASFLVVCPFLWAAEVTLIPYAIGNFLDHLHPLVTYSDVKDPVLLFVGALCMVTCAYRLFNYMVGIRMIPGLRSRLARFGLQHVLNMPYALLKEELPGELSGKISDLPKVVPELLEMFCWRILAPCIALALSLVLLNRKDTVFALITFFWALFFITGNLLMVPYLTDRSAHFARCGNQILGVIADSVLNVFTVKIYKGEAKEEIYLQKSCKQGEKAEQKLQWIYFFMHLCSALVYILTLVGTLYVALHRFREEKISLGDLSVVMHLNLSIAHVLWESSFDFNRIAQHLGRMKQVLGLFYTPRPSPTIEEKNHPLVFHSAPSIRFDHVNFSYSSGAPLFQNLCLTINPEEKIGLVGYSGAGKTSFVQLLLRFYPLNSGKILLNDVPINSMDLELFYQNITFVSQNPQFFRRTIWENLVYGCHRVTLERVEQACKQAGIWSRIQELPLGYHTVLADQGSPLSGGEKQRLSIAKAFLRNTPLLILDEVTAQQDSLTEQSIHTALDPLMHQKTCIVIAHRLRSVTLMDRLFVFNGGNIVQIGSHNVLVQKEGLYKKLWEAQNPTLSLTG